jgi:hypothetical protein
MNRRKASDAGGSVLSFTFLDVLMCTMGSLLLLLVLFGVIVKKSTRARREGEDVTISLAALNAPDAPAQAAAPPAPPAADIAAVEEMSQQLAKLRKEQAEIERIRGEASQRRLEEQDRIAHVEDHERRLEHELAQLHITLEVLEATEQKQTVDQEQAEAEVARLKELIAETESRLDKMRKADTGQKSYAIVPYKGANGTFRRPVFVECTADAVTIQPEGIKLTVEDFDGPLRSGNPLAAAIRAAHEELNGRAAAAGRTDLPDPYPLLIVRPDGAAAYAAAIDAIRSWDSDYGYEFVEADWKLKYPELDPRLAQVMNHAVDEARQRQALLAKVAPRQYGSRLGGAGGGGGGGAGDGDGFGELTNSGTGNRIGSHSGDGAFGGGRDARGNSLRSGGTGGRYGMGGGSGEGGEGNFSDEFAGGGAAAGAIAGGALTTTGEGGPGNGGMGGGGLGDPTAVGGTGGPGSTAVGQGAAGATGEGNARDAINGVNGQYASSAAGQSGQAGSSGANTGAAGTGTSAAGQSGGSAEGTSGSGASGGTSSTASGSSGGGGGNSSGPSGNAGSMGGVQNVQVGPKGGSIADKRGANWANAEAARRTSAITRPVRVLVRAEQLAVIPEGGTEADAQVVSFKQPVERVVDQLAGAVQMQVVDWGLAGDGMYWRPTLVVAVAPGAERQAERLAQLLDNSGLDVRLPQSTANAGQTERQ